MAKDFLGNSEIYATPLSPVCRFVKSTSWDESIIEGYLPKDFKVSLTGKGMMTPDSFILVFIHVSSRYEMRTMPFFSVKALCSTPSIFLFTYFSLGLYSGRASAKESGTKFQCG